MAVLKYEILSEAPLPDESAVKRFRAVLCLLRPRPLQRRNQFAFLPCSHKVRHDFAAAVDYRHGGNGAAAI